MPLAYIEGKEQVALQFCEKQLELENEPTARKQIEADIQALKAKMGKQKQHFLSESDETVTST